MIAFLAVKLIFQIRTKLINEIIDSLDVSTSLSVGLSFTASSICLIF